MRAAFSSLVARLAAALNEVDELFRRRNRGRGRVRSFVKNTLDPGIQLSPLISHPPVIPLRSHFEMSSPFEMDPFLKGPLLINQQFHTESL